MSSYTVVGKSFPRLDSPLKATGKAEYSGDIKLPKMLYGKILRSPYPHAKILRIDTQKAERLKGVKAVVTGKDTYGIKFSILGEKFADCTLLAIDKVRYIGDAVTSVAAIDEDTAEEALDLIEVEYEELPAVFNPEEAMKPGSPKIHDHSENNVLMRTFFNYAKVEKGFKESYHVREDRFITSSVAHCQMEPHTTISSFDPITGRLTHWSGTMAAHSMRGGLAWVLKMPESSIRVISPYMGGGFGGRAGLFSLDICAALLSMKTNTPVKIAHTREEQFINTRIDFPMTLSLKTGVKRDGTILAHEFNVLVNNGAYAYTGPLVVYLILEWLVGTYKIPNLRYEGTAVYTNNPVGGAKRSHGNPQKSLAIESQIDMIAHEIGMDPMEIRLKNAVKTGDILLTKDKIISCGFSECIIKSSEVSLWKEKRGKMGIDKGIGMASCHLFGGGSFLPPPNMPTSGALLKCNEDGTVSLFTGVVDTGQGAGSMLAQIAAEELGIKMDDIKVVFGDTDVTPPDISSHLSAGAFVTGNAVKIAACDAKHQILDIVAEKLEVNADDLEIKDRRIYVKGSPQKGISLLEAVKTSIYEKDGNPILGKGYYSPGVKLPDLETGEGPYSSTFSYANAVAELRIDKETGHVKVERITLAQDCGLAINPMEVEGQNDGSISMAQGQALSEQLYFERGQILNPSFRSYGIPRSVDVAEHKTIIVESIDPKGPFGAKECGESSTASSIPSIANAIYDAIGVRIKESPITPEKILEALEEKNKLGGEERA